MNGSRLQSAQLSAGTASLGGTAADSEHATGFNVYGGYIGLYRGYMGVIGVIWGLYTYVARSVQDLPFLGNKA